MIIRIATGLLVCYCVAATALAQTAPATSPASSTSPLTKIKDIVVYRDDTFHCAFPSIVRRPDGELLVAFRRAPDPRVFGNAGVTHTDPCSQLVMVRSTDNGET